MKIVVHIKAAEQEPEPKAKTMSKPKSTPKASKKQASESTSSLFEKLNLKTPIFSSHSLSSTMDDNDEFQGSVFEFENKVASSK